ncbi:MAG: 50S ribosomal protein L29 [Candidatus Omnitrophica bacterium]|nr:50S ribosomal protein L29 [Candidatus Omnitrophota bacterium]
MAILKIHELRNKSTEELKERTGILKKELYELRLAASTGKIEKPHQFKEKKIEIAKILTILKEKETRDGSSTKTA